MTSRTYKLNTQLCHIPSVKYHLVTHHLSHTITSHTTLSHTICQQPSCTHHLFVIFLSHTICQIPPCCIPSFTDAAKLSVAGVALGDIYLGFTWQAWHNLTSTVVLRGRRGTHGTGWRTWARLVARDAAALCVAGVALGDITWQAWRNLTSTFVLCGSLTHPLSHTTLSHTIFHTPSFTHNFVTHHL